MRYYDQTINHVQITAQKGKQAQDEKRQRDLAAADLAAATSIQEDLTNGGLRDIFLAAEIHETTANHLANDAMKLRKAFPEAITPEDFKAGRVEKKILTINALRALGRKPKTAIQIGKAVAVIAYRAIQAIKALTPAAKKAFDAHLERLIKEGELKAQSLSEKKAKLDVLNAQLAEVRRKVKAVKAAA